MKRVLQKFVLLWAVLSVVTQQLSCGRPGDVELSMMLGRTSVALSTRPQLTPPEPLASTTEKQFAPLGSGEVTPFGTFKYTIPLDLPPGRVGMEPHLSLVYESDGGNGPLGMGWSIQGGSEITRCDGVVASGGIRKGIKGDNTDNFCLDGQRLVLVAGENGAENAQYRTEQESFSRVWITDVSDAGPQNWLVEHKDGTSASYSPFAGGHRDELNANGTVASATPVHSIWSLNYHQDKFGNAIRWSYSERSNDDQNPNWMNDSFGLLNGVQYTICGGSICHFYSWQHFVEFVYEQRDPGDVIDRFVGGVRFRNTKRLKAVKIYASGDLIGEYRLGYKQSLATKRTLLETVTRCDAAGACFPPTRMLYRDQLGQYTVNTQSRVAGTNNFMYAGTLANAVDMEIVAFDANGDGNDDILLHERWNGTTSGSPKEKLVVADGIGYFTHSVDVNWEGSPCGRVNHMGAATPVDLDANGRPEIVHECWEDGYRVLGWDSAEGELREKNVAGLSGKAMPRWEERNPYSDNRPYAEGLLKFGDLDGDGLPDMLWGNTHVGNDRWTAQRAIFTPGSGDVEQISYGPNRPTAIPSAGPAISDTHPDWSRVGLSGITTFLDRDGDGHMELSVIDFATQKRGYTWGVESDVVYTLHDDTGARVIREENSFSAEPSSTAVWGQTNFGGDYEHGLWYFLDVNGDGLQDGLYRKEPYPGQGPIKWYLRINTGAGYLPPTAVGPAQATLDAYVSDIHFILDRSFVTKGLDNGLRIGDMNGDGRDDIVLLHPATAPTAHASGFLGSTGTARVLHSNGTGFDLPITLPPYQAGFTRLMKVAGAENPLFPMSTLADIDGNGIMDLVELVADTATRRRIVTTNLALPGGIDVMTSVSQNDANQQSIDYSPLTFDTSGTYSLQATPEYPRAATTRRHIVNRHVALIPGERQVTKRYDYETALMDVTGRGFLGFETIREMEFVTTTHTYDLAPFEVGSFRHYPRQGRPITTQASQPTSGDASLADATGAIPRPRATWSAVYSGHPLQKRSETESQFQHQNETGSRVVTETTYDDYENPRTVVTTSTDVIPGQSDRVYTRTVTTTFTNDVDAWRIGEPSRIVERLQANVAANPLQFDPAAGEDVTRTTDLFYDEFRQISSIVREPGRAGTTDSRLSLERFVRDINGLVTERWLYSPTSTSCGGPGDCGAGEECRRAIEPNGVQQCFAARTETFDYDVRGIWVEGYTNAAGHTSWELRDPTYGWVYATVDPNGAQELFTYDGFGRERERESDLRDDVETTYKEDGIHREHSNNFEDSIYIDATGRPDFFIWITYDGLTGLGKVGYDVLGNAISAQYAGSSGAYPSGPQPKQLMLDRFQNPIQLMAARYDVLGRPASSTKGSDETTAYSYDTLGQVTITDPRGFQTTRLHDQHGRILSLTQESDDETEFETTYSYDASGVLSSLRNPDGIVERFYRDSIGRPNVWRTGVPSATVAHNVRWRATYDGFDDIIEETQDGVVVAYERDELGRVIERVSEGETQTYGWDPDFGIGRIGLMTTDAAGGHETAFAFTRNGSLRSEERIDRFADGTSLTLRLQFGGEHLQWITYPEYSSTDVHASPHTMRRAPRVTYERQRGHLKTAFEQRATGLPIRLWQANLRHPLGMVTRSTHYTDGAQSLTTTFTYDDNTLRLEGRSTTGITSGPAPTLGYTYDPNGAVETKTTGAITETFGYDGALEFLRTYEREGPQDSQIEATFAYGSQGITGIDTTVSDNSPDWPGDETYTYRAANDNLRRNYNLQTHRIGTGPTQSFTYDKNRVREVREGSTVKRRYTWNSFNLPTLVEHFGPNLTRSFVYDALGGRVKKHQSANNEVHYVSPLYESRNLTALNVKESIFRVPVEGQIVAEIVHLWGGDTAQVRHLINDDQNSPAFQVVGRTSTQLGFFPYGKRMNAAGATAPAQNFSQIGYTGHRHDDDIGLINMNGRVYDITRRRFLTPDPVLDQPFTTFGTQPYSYVAHNPTNFTDPTGFYQGGDSRWRSQSLMEAQQNQNCQCVCIGADMREFKQFYDDQWGSEGSDPVDSPSPGGGRGAESAGRSWVTSGAQSFQGSGLVTPSSLGNLGGARSQGATQAPSQVANPAKMGVEILKRAGPHMLRQARRDARALQRLGQLWLRAAQQDVRYLQYHGNRLWESATKLLEPVQMHRHHLLPQKFRDFFSARGIDIDKFTVGVSRGQHLQSIHGRGDLLSPGRWNQRWDEFVKANPNATAKQIYQHLGSMMDDFGLSNVDIVPYR